MMMAIMGLLGRASKMYADTIRFNGHDLQQLSARQRRAITGKDIAMVFQDPTNSLNPCFTVGFQLAEILKLHLGMGAAAARQRSIALLDQVGISEPEHRLRAYPHQLSGGLNQRIMIAMAIACQPKLLIADEPTTALDVSIQAQILTLLHNLQKENGMALLLITHNMGIVSSMTQRVAVMYAGQIMEERATHALFNSPRHPYSEALLAALPDHNKHDAKLYSIPGTIPDTRNRPTGCLFAPRCHFAEEICQNKPQTISVQQGTTRCHFPIDASGAKLLIDEAVQ
jgi:dipeptide transport system ATP-binding protein